MPGRVVAMAVSGYCSRVTGKQEGTELLLFADDSGANALVNARAFMGS